MKTSNVCVCVNTNSDSKTKLVWRVGGGGREGIGRLLRGLEMWIKQRFNIKL